MDVSSAGSILFRVHEQPAVKAAQARIDATARELDKIELSRKGDWNTRMTNYESTINGMWDNSFQTTRQLSGTVILMGILGGALATSAIASMVPALVPFKGVLMLGSLVAGWKLLPPLAGKYIVRPLLKRSVNRQMDRFLDGEHQRKSRDLEHYRAQYDRAVRSVTEELASRAAQDQLTRQGKQPQNTEVKIEEQQVKLGGIVVPRRAEAQGLS